MRRRTRIVLVLLLTALLTVAAFAALAVAADQARDVDIADVAVGGLGRSGGRDHSSAIALPLRADLLGASWTGSAGS
ncbi:MAG: hypothetical protein KDC46_15690, partial [Thermoleophilia bacterium]|nr:hypothetical protein [Thermoleophilia bacterium]